MIHLDMNAVVQAINNYRKLPEQETILHINNGLVNFYVSNYYGTREVSFYYKDIQYTFFISDDLNFHKFRSLVKHTNSFKLRNMSTFEASQLNLILFKLCQTLYAYSESCN